MTTDLKHPYRWILRVPYKIRRLAGLEKRENVVRRAKMKVLACVLKNIEKYS